MPLTRGQRILALVLLVEMDRDQTNGYGLRVLQRAGQV
jgi:hypothetical protein